MKKLSWMSGGTALAVAGGGAAALLVVALMVFNPRIDPVELAVQQDKETGAETPAEPRTEAAGEPVGAPVGTAQQSGDAPAQGAVSDPAAIPDAPASVGTDGAVEQETDEVAMEAPADAAEATAQPPVGTVAETEADTPEGDPVGASSQGEQPQDVAIAALPQDDAQPGTDQPVTDQGSTEQGSTGESAAEVTQPDPAPSFDTVRLAPDGEALVAGRARAGDTVEILLDGETVGSTVVGSDGAFVAFLSLPESDAPRVLTLAASDSDATRLSTEQVIIAPMAQPDSAIAVSTAAPDAPPVPGSAPAATTQEGAPTTSTPALLLSDGDGIRVLQPATPADPAASGPGVALDVISYTNDGDVLLQGRGAADSTVLIYLDNALLSKAETGADRTWSVALPAISAGVYTLRLDEVNAEGRVLSRIETPFKREDRAEVAAIAAAGAQKKAQAQVNGAATGDSAADQDATARAGTEDSSIRVVTVQPGNTLWAIARESYGEGILFVRLFEANRERIRNPDLIYPGQIFEIPE